MARFTAGLLKTAMKSIYEHEKGSILAYIAKLDEGSVGDHIQETQGTSVLSRATKSANDSSNHSQSA